MSKHGREIILSVLLSAKSREEINQFVHWRMCFACAFWPILTLRENSMTKLSTFALLSALIIATPAFADSTPGGVAADVGAVQKDNQAIGKDNSELATDRAAKANDKANGNLGGQAVDSLSIGDDKVMKSEKKTEKSVDKKILNHDVNEATDK